MPLCHVMFVHDYIKLNNIGLKYRSRVALELGDHVLSTLRQTCIVSEKEYSDAIFRRL